MSLSPGGCHRYRRQLDGDRVVSEAFSVGGRDTLTRTHTPSETSSLVDGDGDGFFERHTTVTRVAATGEERTVGTEYSPHTRKPVRRQQVSHRGGFVRVVCEEADPAGTLRPVADFESDSRLPVTGRPELMVMGVTADAGATDGGTIGDLPCTQEHVSLVRGLISAVLVGGVTKDGKKFGGGLKCLEAKGATFLLPPLRDIGLSEIPLVCRDSLNPNSTGGHAAVLRGTLYLSNRSFWSLDDAMQRAVIFHELMHLALEKLGMDEPDAAATGMDFAEGQEEYRAHACGAMCFPPNPDVTICACIKCLFGCTTKECFRVHCCEKGCQTVGPGTAKRYERCRQDLGAFCKCRSRRKWYDSEPECAARCPSGLACFASHCKTCDDPEMCTG